MAGAAGHNFLDPPPLNPPGPATRAAVLAGLVGLDFVHQYLFEGGNPDFLLDEEGDTSRTLRLLAATPTFGGAQLSKASLDSVNCGNTVQCLFEYNFTVPLTIFAWELWYRQPDLGHNRCVLMGAPLNSNINIGRFNNTFNYPMFRNDTNQTVGWESEVDLYGDNKIHQLIEAHEPATRENFILYIDGMPVASGTNAGVLNDGSSGSQGGWSSGQQGPAFNGRNVGLTNAERSGADFGSFHFYDGGAELTQLAVRQLYEGTAITVGVNAPAGLESGVILDAQLSASTEFDAARGAEFARLNNADGSHWAPLTSNTGEWWKIDFGSIVQVVGISTQGGGGTANFVETYNLEFNDDDSATWIQYSGNPLTGNSDTSSIVTNALVPFTCRFLRFRALTWTSFINLRAEFELRVEAIPVRTIDMLTSPRWFILDSINCTVSAAPAKDLTCGDVTDNTGGRSGAIPRNGKVYFEVEIIAQGDDTASNLLGLRRLSEGGNVGFTPTIPDFEYHTDGAGDVVDGQGTTLGITGTLGTAATARIFQFAIDWASGDWWMGTDNTVFAGVGGVGNPSTGANPLTALDIRFNWAVIDRVNGANGNGVVRLITADADLNFAKPTGYVAWEDAI